MTRMAGTLLTAAVCVAVLATGRAQAATEAAMLNTCQKAVGTAAATFVKGKETAISACLNAVSGAIIGRQGTDPSAAAKTCVAQFRLLNDSRKIGKSLPEKLATAIAKFCNPNAPLTVGDILGSPPSLAQTLEVSDQLGEWCTAFGGNGSIATVGDWTSCVNNGAECAVDTAISTQYPRALEWLAAVRTPMLSVKPSDPAQVSDAVAALDAVKLAIDGPDNDNIPSPVCGQGGQLSTCQTDLTSCTGNLSACQGSLAACNAGTAQAPSQPLRTGQTTTYGTGSDGDSLKGNVRWLTDNGDGTITDNQTWLMWEKKDQAAGGIHNCENMYTWGMTDPPYTMNGTMVTEFLATLNRAPCFAGHCDWRIPNVNELQTLVNRGTGYPPVDAAFNTSCPTGCTVDGASSTTMCSCTYSGPYWSSTTDQPFPVNAWFVSFLNGEVFRNLGKSLNFSVRAVRGGS